MSLAEIAVRFPGAAKAVLVTDTNVDRFWGDEVVHTIEASGLLVDRLVIPAGETSKSLESYAHLVRAFAQLELTRSDIAIALGGGVVSDLTGFAAATYMRGINWVAIPTTLLAMVDASVGGKTGIDLPEGKNLAGAFWQSALTIRDEHYLSTLPERERRNGLAEILKMHVLTGCALNIESAVREKERIVAMDFRDQSARQLLNLGHTFGHAIEVASDYAVPHGEAVAMGMRIVAKDAPDVLKLIDQHGYRPLDFDRAAVLRALTMDKKRRADTITLVIPQRIGECELVEQPLTALEQWI